MVDAVTLPNPVTPSSAELPKDASPVVALPQSVTPVVNDECPLLCWLPFELLIGGGKSASVGFSVNDAASANNYDNSFTGMLRGSVFLTPSNIGERWQYNTQAFVFGQLDQFEDPLGKIWSVGAGAAARFSYAVQYGAFAVAADLAGSLGVLWMEKPSEVGIPGKLYWAADSYLFPQVHGGVGVYFDWSTPWMSTPEKELKLTVGVRTGARVMFHESHVTNVPAGMPQDTTVGLKSPIWETIQGVFGIYF